MNIVPLSLYYQRRERKERERAAKSRAEEEERLRIAKEAQEAEEARQRDAEAREREQARADAIAAEAKEVSDRAAQKQIRLEKMLGIACGGSDAAKRKRKQLFDRIDDDHDGVITLEEFGEALRRDLKMTLCLGLPRAFNEGDEYVKNDIEIQRGGEREREL